MNKNAVNPVDINNIKDKSAGVFQNIIQGTNTHTHTHTQMIKQMAYKIQQHSDDLLK